MDSHRESRCPADLSSLATDASATLSTSRSEIPMMPALQEPCRTDCFECAGPIHIDYQHAELVCEDCGLVNGSLLEIPSLKCYTDDGEEEWYHSGPAAS